MKKPKSSLDKDKLQQFLLSYYIAKNSVAIVVG